MERNFGSSLIILSYAAVRDRIKLTGLTDAELSAACDAVKQEKLATLRALVPQYLPEDM